MSLPTDLVSLLKAMHNASVSAGDLAEKSAIFSEIFVSSSWLVLFVGGGGSHGCSRSGGIER